MWTYNKTLASPKDQVRLMLGDTDIDDQMFSDEEINGMIGIAGTPIGAAISLADGAAAKLSRIASITVDGLTVSQGGRGVSFQTLADRLRAMQAEQLGVGGVPFVSGVSRGEMRAVDDNLDREPSAFKVGMHDDPGVRVRQR